MNSASRPNNTAAGSDNTSAGSDNTWDNSSIASVMLVASLLVRCERPTACRGHEPDTGYDTSAHRIGATPLKIEEPVKPDASRGHIRAAVAQLLDYRRHLPELQRATVLLPRTPSRDLQEFVASTGLELAIFHDGELRRIA